MTKKIWLRDGKILLKNGKIMVAETCCCDEPGILYGLRFDYRWLMDYTITPVGYAVNALAAPPASTTTNPLIGTAGTANLDEYWSIRCGDAYFYNGSSWTQKISGMTTTPPTGYLWGPYGSAWSYYCVASNAAPRGASRDFTASGQVCALMPFYASGVGANTLNGYKLYTWDPSTTAWILQYTYTMPGAPAYGGVIADFKYYSPSEWLALFVYFDGSAYQIDVVANGSAYTNISTVLPNLYDPAIPPAITAPQYYGLPTGYHVPGLSGDIKGDKVYVFLNALNCPQLSKYWYGNFVISCPSSGGSWSIEDFWGTYTHWPSPYPLVPLDFHIVNSKRYAYGYDTYNAHQCNTLDPTFRQNHSFGSPSNSWLAHLDYYLIPGIQGAGEALDIRTDTIVSIDDTTPSPPTGQNPYHWWGTAVYGLARTRELSAPGGCDKRLRALIDAAQFASERADGIEASIRRLDEAREKAKKKIGFSEKITMAIAALRSGVAVDWDGLRGSIKTGGNRRGRR